MRRWNRQKLKAIKYLGGKCKICNIEGHPAIFDFHHRDKNDKELDWARLRIRSWDKIKKELNKCDLLCALCHRLEHIQEKFWDFSCFKESF